ncbi:uncharacterized protein LOC130735911 [Lotus japonicus]|uniref:uncharacterized protein LOC130735911 n=1 Tax=Lotus japonicus TaxID=34305 RepID=UPI00258DBC7D|nr:uncharacterized protein LOC130735911 [Lotus japonicus]
MSRNVPQNGFNELKQLLNVKAVEIFDKYLGLPTMIGKSKTRIFNFVKDRVWKKLKGWKESTLSRADIERMSFNIALVAKNWWRIYTQPETLLAQVFKGVYFAQGDLLGAKRGYRPSYAWSCILQSSWIFQEGGRWKIGDGSQVDILHDQWLPQGVPIIGSQDLMAEFGVSNVSHLIDHAAKSWKYALVDFIFYPATVSHILKIPLPLNGSVDTLMWPETVDGNYCSKSGYIFVRRKLLGACSSTSSQPSLPAPLWKKFWRTSVQPRCKEVVWRVVSSLLLVRAALRRRGMDVDPLCPVCADEEETVFHLFVSCPVA